jgi:hypothetical protein
MDAVARAAFAQGSAKHRPTEVFPGVLPTKDPMRAQKVVRIAALVLMAASLIAVALDETIFPGADHRPGNCPVCSWANSLSSSVVPVLVRPVESTPRSWMAQDPSPVFCNESPHRAFAARAPPTLPTA